jgi:tetratricopeptide (TPR) repeat protein
MTRSAYREAVTFFEQALNALHRLPTNPDTQVQAIDLRLDLRSALWPLGELRRISVVLQDAAAVAEAQSDQHRLGWVYASLLANYSQTGDWDLALAPGQRALAIATDLGDVGLTVMAQHYLGHVYRSLGDYRRAVDFYRKNVTHLQGELLYERLGMPGLPSVISRSFFICSLTECGAFAEGIDPAAEGVRIAEAADHPFSRVVAYWAIGFRSLHQGNFQQAIPMFERALDMAQGASLRLLVPWVTAFLGAAYTLAGRAADILPLLEQAVEQSMAMGLMLHHALRVAWRGEAYLLAGRLDEAYTQAQRALEFSQAHQERGHEAYTLRLLGEIATHRAPLQAEAAEASYHQALALAEELGMRPLQAHCNLGLGRLYLKTEQIEQARIALSTAIDLYRAMDMTFWLPQAKAALAQTT